VLAAGNGQDVAGHQLVRLRRASATPPDDKR
jgi:hypothetical protein